MVENTQIISAVILGIVEGLTEFLPVSSTGHLIIFAELLDFKASGEATFEIAIQAGAIMAVILVYWQRFWGLFTFENNPQKFAGIPACVKLAIACFPSFLLGFLLHGWIKSELFSTTVVGISLIVGGVVFILLPNKGDENKVKTLDNITYKQSFWIGISQIFALCPGVSRSGSTIVGGILSGLDRATAAQFSFLLAVPTLFAAVFYDLYKNFSLLLYSDLPIFLMGTVVSFFSGLIAIRTFIALISKYSLGWWGVYRILIGTLVLIYFI